MFNMSSGEAPKFVAAVNQMTERIKGLGPSKVTKVTKVSESD